MDQNRTDFVLRAWRAAWGEGEVEGFLKILTPDYVRHGKSGDEDANALRLAIEQSRAAFPDLRTDILQSVEEGDHLAIRWQSVGTHTGSFMGVPNTGRTVTTVGASFCRFEDGLLAEEWVVWDPREFLAALGIWSVGSD